MKSQDEDDDDESKYRGVSRGGTIPYSWSGESNLSRISWFSWFSLKLDGKIRFV